MGSPAPQPTPAETAADTATQTKDTAATNTNLQNDPNVIYHLNKSAPDPQNGQNSTDLAAATMVQANQGMQQYNQNALALPSSAAYIPENAANNYTDISKGQNLGKVANNGHVGDVNLGHASQYGASQYNAAGISPLMMLNGGAQVAMGNQNANQQASQQAINNLNNIATGHGPNAATIAAQQQGQQNSAAQMAAIASAGGNPALAQRNAAEQAASNRQQTAANAVLGSAQEQLGAQGTLQSALNNQTVSGQAIPLAQAQLNQQAALANQNVQSTGSMTQAQLDQQAAAGNAAAKNAASAGNASALNNRNLQQGSMNQQTNLANQQALIASTGLNAQQYNAMLGAQMQQSSFDTAQAENYQNAYQSAQENLTAAADKVGIASMSNTTQLIGAGMGAVGALGAGAASMIPNSNATSDRRAKTGIRAGTRDLKQFFNALNGK